MGSKAEMALILSLVDEVSKTAKKVKDGLGDVGKAANDTKLTIADLGGGLAKLGAAGLAVGAAAVAAGVTAIGGAAFAAGMQYDDAMDTIAIATGATGDELAALGKDFRKVFTSIPTDAATASGVIGELNRTLGVSGDALVDLAKPMAEASRMMGTDAAKSAKGFGEAMNAWKVDVEDAPAALDALFVATQKSGVGFDELLSNLSTFGPALQTVGFSLTESTALLAGLEKAGMPATDVMTALQFAAKTFTKEGVPLQEGLAGVIASITEATSTEEALALGMETFGARAALPMVEAIRSGKFNLDEMTASLKGAEGAIMETADATADFPEKFQVLKNVAANALAPIGVGMMDIVTKIVEHLTPAFEGIAAFMSETVVPAFETLAEAFGLALGGDVQGALEMVFGAATTEKIMGVVDAIGKVWGFLQENWEPIIAGIGAAAAVAFTAWAVAQWPAVASSIALMTANAPLIALVAGIAVVVGLLAKAWKEDWGGIQEKTAEVVDWIKINVGEFLDKIQAWWDEHGDAIVARVTELWEGVKTAFSDATERVKTIISDALAAIKAWWDEHGDAVKDIVDKFMDGIKGIIDTVLGVITGIFDTFKLAFEGDWYGFGEKLRETADEAWDKIKQVFTDFKDALLGIWDMIDEDVTEAWNGILDWLKELPDKIIAFFTETDWGQIGQNILEGIANGLTAGLDWLKDAARKVAQAALDAMKGLLGIHSPSRVAEFQVGAPIGEGIIAGLRRATPDLLAASKSMMGDTIGIMSGMGSTAQPSNMASRAQDSGAGGTIRAFTTEALQQLFEMNAASVTMPLAQAIVAQLRGESEADMGGTLRALSAA